MIGYSIDVSHHQRPGALPWTLYQGSVDLVIARACYGAEYADPTCAEHIERARGIGARIGLYAFYRHSQPWEAQARALEAAAYQARHSIGDVVPALDIEADPLPHQQEVSHEWAEPCRMFVEAIRSTFGECIVYITRRDWHSLGSPAWVLDRPLWVAHYTDGAPALPGDNVSVQPVMHQHRVGPFLRGGQGGVFLGTTGNPQVDQSRILAPLPLVGGGTWAPAIAPPMDHEGALPTEPPEHAPDTERNV